MNNSIATFLISETAWQDGYGSEKIYKLVKGLSTAELETAQAGTPVYFRAARLSRCTINTQWRVVKVDGKKVYPRVPSREAVEMLRGMTGLN